MIGPTKLVPVVRLKFRLIAHKQGLSNSSSIFRKSFSGALEAIGKRLQSSARTRMREDTGAAKKNLTYKVSLREPNWNVVVFGTVVQAFVNAYGLKRGVFPDFAVNSKLYNWVKRRQLLGALKSIPRTDTGTEDTPRRRLRKVKRIRKVRSAAGSSEPLNARRRFKAKNTDTKRLTFLVARAIYRHGIKGTDWPKKTLEANKNRIMTELKNAISRAVNEMKRAS